MKNTFFILLLIIFIGGSVSSVYAQTEATKSKTVVIDKEKTKTDTKANLEKSDATKTDTGIKSCTGHQGTKKCCKNSGDPKKCCKKGKDPQKKCAHAEDHHKEGTKSLEENK